MEFRKALNKHSIIILNLDTVYLEQSLAETWDINLQTRIRRAVPSESPAELNYYESSLGPTFDDTISLGLKCDLSVSLESLLNWIPCIFDSVVPGWLYFKDIFYFILI